MKTCGYHIHCNIHLEDIIDRYTSNVLGKIYIIYLANLRIIISVILKQNYFGVSPFIEAFSSGLYNSFIDLVPSSDLPKWKPSPRWPMKRLKGKRVFIVWQCAMSCTKLVSSLHLSLNNNQVTIFN